MGWQWLYTSIWGSVFCLLQMVNICMQAVMLEKVFYGIPHKMGYFGTHDHAVAVADKDDEFKAVTTSHIN